MKDINIPEFIATVAAQIKEASEEANKRIREKQDDPFLLLRDLQLQVAFTAEESKTSEGRLELRPWILSAAGGRTKGQRSEIVHTVTLNLSPVVSQPTGGMGSTGVLSSDSFGGIGIIVNNEDVAKSIIRGNPGLWKGFFPDLPEDKG